MKIYLVGGAVRDSLLNQSIQEKDWVVVGSTPEELINQGFQQVGASFPVFLHPQTHEEYALARTEKKHGHGYKGFSCHFSPEVGLEEDLLRRDLTINAIAMDEKGHYIDPYHGIQDLKHKILRHVSPAFVEDPLRVLRVARFHAKLFCLGFSIATETFELMKSLVQSNELKYLTIERVWKEWEKAFNTPNPEIFLQTLQLVGALHQFAPEINEIPEKLLAKISQYTTNSIYKMVLFWNVLFFNHDIDKQIDIFLSFANRLRMPKHIIELSIKFFRLYHFVINKVKHTAEETLILLEKVDAFRKTSLFLECLECLELSKTMSPKEHLSWIQMIHECKEIKLSPDLQHSNQIHAIQGFFKQQRLNIILSYM